MQSVYWQTDWHSEWWISCWNPKQENQSNNCSWKIFPTFFFSSVFWTENYFFLSEPAGRIICQSNWQHISKLAQLTFNSVRESREILTRLTVKRLWTDPLLRWQSAPCEHRRSLPLYCCFVTKPPIKKRKEKKQRPSIKLSAHTVPSSKP